MPAGSERSPDATVGVPDLPHSFRPLGVRVAFYVAGGALGVVTLAVWVAFPPEVREQFTTFQRATLVVLGLGFYALGWGLGRSRLVARDTGLTVVNGFRTRQLEWNEVLGVSLRSSSPWATLDVSDGSTVSVLGIQSSDGARARRQVRQVRALVARHTH